MARPARFERATLCLEGRCSIQLSYGRVDFDWLSVRPFQPAGHLFTGFSTGATSLSDYKTKGWRLLALLNKG